MTTLEQLLLSAKDYLIAHTKRNERFHAWTEGGIRKFVWSTLNTIKTSLTHDNDFFSHNLYVGEIPYVVEQNGKIYSSKPMGGILIKSGSMIHTAFEGENGGNLSTNENGFEVRFIPIPNGKIHVYLVEHAIDDAGAPTQTIALVENLNDLTEDYITKLVLAGINAAKQSSFYFTTV